MMKIAERMDHLGTESAFEVFARASKLEAQGKKIIHLEIGQPDFPTPPHICEAAFRAMKAGYTGYGPAAGLPELREEVANYVSTTRGLRSVQMKSRLLRVLNPSFFHVAGISQCRR